MKRSSFLLIVVVLLAGLICSCGSDPYDKENDTAFDTIEDNTIHTSNEIIYPIENLICENVLSGSMVYTINSGVIVSDLSELGLKYTDLLQGELAQIQTHGENGEYMLVKWPEYISENGNLIDDVYLVFLDVTVTNIDAISEDGNHRFSSNGLFWLWDSSSNITYGNQQYNSTYRLYDTTRAYVFECKPGESFTFQVGFIVSGDIISLRDNLAMVNVSAYADESTIISRLVFPE